MSCGKEKAVVDHSTHQGGRFVWIDSLVLFKG